MAADPSGSRPATEFPEADLTEIVHAIRRDLLRRGEFLPPSWIEEAASDLRAGRLIGRCLSGPTGLEGISFTSWREGRAYGHVHVAHDPSAVRRGETLTDELIGLLPDGIRRLDVGFTGLDEASERELAVRLDRRPGGGHLIRRFLLRGVAPEPPQPPMPYGLRAERVRSVAMPWLAELDRRAFAQGPDEALLDPTLEGSVRTLGEILKGRLGRFLDEASTVLVGEDGAPRAILLTAERSPRAAIFHGLVVDPGLRRLGVATYLLCWGFRALRALGYETGSLWVSEPNTPATALYERMGFRLDGTALLFHYAPPVDGPQPQRAR